MEGFFLFENRAWGDYSITPIFRDKTYHNYQLKNKLVDINTRIRYTILRDENHTMTKESPTIKCQLFMKCR